MPLHTDRETAPRIYAIATGEWEDIQGYFSTKELADEALKLISPSMLMQQEYKIIPLLIDYNYQIKL